MIILAIIITICILVVFWMIMRKFNLNNSNNMLDYEPLPPPPFVEELTNIKDTAPIETIYPTLASQCLVYFQENEPAAANINYLTYMLDHNPIEPTLEADQIIDDLIQIRTDFTNDETEQLPVQYHHELAQQQRPDSQNVHDAHVTNDLYNTYQLLLESRCDDALPHDTVLYQINQQAASKGQKTASNVDRTLSKLDTSKLYFDSQRVGVPLVDILDLVWNRTNHPDNIHVQDTAKNAIIESLDDAVEHGNVVCSTGIGARLLTSLAAIDSNETIGSATTQQQKNASIFNKAHELLQQQINECKARDPLSDLAKYADTFNTGADDSSFSTTTKNMFNKQYEEKIDAMLTQEQHIKFKDMKDQIMAGVV